MALLILCYKFHYSLNDVLDLTQPQVQILNKILFKILQAENPSTDSKDNKSEPVNNIEQNNLVMEETVKMLKKRTKRDTFTMEEVINPMMTIKKHFELYPELKEQKDKKE